MTKARWLKWLILFGILMILLYLTFLFINLNQVKKLITNNVKEATGRELVINGRLHIELSWWPTLRAENVTFSNPSWAQQPYLLQAKEVTLQLKLMPLFSGDVELESVELQGAEFWLATNQQGTGNWELDWVPKASNSNKWHFSLPHEVTISGSTFQYHNGKTNKLYTLAGPYQITTELSNGTHQLDFQQIQATFGKNQLAGNLSFIFQPKLIKFNAKLKAKYLDLNKLISVEYKKSGKKPTKQSAKKKNAPDNYVGKLELVTNQLRFSDIELNHVNANAELNKDTLRVNRLEAVFNGGKLNASMQLSQPGSQLLIKTNGDILGANVGETLHLFGLSRRYQGGSLDVSFDVATSGSSGAQFAKNIAGNIKLAIRNVKFARADKDKSGESFFELLTGKKKSKDVAIICAKGGFSVKNEIATSKTIYLETGTARVAGAGQINLGKGTLNLLLKPKAKGLTLAQLAVPFKVTGPMSNPHYYPMVTTGGVIKTIAGVATGAGILGVVGIDVLDKVLISGKQPCHL